MSAMSTAVLMCAIQHHVRVLCTFLSRFAHCWCISFVANAACLPVRDAVRLRALWPGPACAPIYVPCARGTLCNLFAALGVRISVRSLCNRRRSGLNQPGISFQNGTGPRLSLIVRGPVDEKCDS